VHLKIITTFNKIKEQHFWPIMYNDIKEYIQICDICQHREHK
ncbi:20358_t:CDS:1, partial [Gigaspora margarita]